MAWDYADRLGNLDVDLIGAADSLTWDVLLVVMLIDFTVVVVVSLWVGVGGGRV